MRGSDTIITDELYQGRRVHNWINWQDQKRRDIQQSVVAYQMASLSQHDKICFVQLRSVALVQQTWSTVPLDTGALWKDGPPFVWWNKGAGMFDVAINEHAYQVLITSCVYIFALPCTCSVWRTLEEWQSWRNAKKKRWRMPVLSKKKHLTVEQSKRYDRVLYSKYASIPVGSKHFAGNSWWRDKR